jgi:prenylcysteine oxidase/farnesylcysteine lyase
VSTFEQSSKQEESGVTNHLYRFISTMETETLASRNVVDLLFEKQFAAGICPPDAELSPPDNVGADLTGKKMKVGWGGAGADGLIYGWDC